MRHIVLVSAGILLFVCCGDNGSSVVNGGATRFTSSAVAVTLEVDNDHPQVGEPATVTCTYELRDGTAFKRDVTYVGHGLVHNIPPLAFTSGDSLWLDTLVVGQSARHEFVVTPLRAGEFLLGVEIWVPVDETFVAGRNTNVFIEVEGR
jgi:hypothetical protein